jgi:hypothetical protein
VQEGGLESSMRTLNAFWALTLFGVFTGCGGSNGLSPLPKSVAPLITAPSSAKPDRSPLSGEAFSARNVTVTTTICGGGKAQFKAANFSASGQARGPYPGTFHATGGWGWESIYGNVHWRFSESFTITSGTSTISGTSGAYENGSGPVLTCKTFGPAGKAAGIRYRFRIDGIHYSGPLAVRDIANGSLHEKLL